MSCIVYKCEGKHSLRHNLPKNNELRRKWLVALQRQDLISKQFKEVYNLKVCGNHFQSVNYRNPESYKLNMNTVPIQVQKEGPPDPQLELTVKTTLEVSKKQDKCLVRGCNLLPRLTSQRLHRVPKRKDVREQWLKNIGREDLLKMPYSTIIHRYVCGAHFEPSQYCYPGSVKLLRSAVPRLLHSDNVSCMKTLVENTIEDEIVATGEVTAPLLCDNKMLLKTKSTYSKHKYQMTFKDDTPAPPNIVAPTVSVGTKIETQRKSLGTENEDFTSESKSDCMISILKPLTITNNERINNNSKQTISKSNSNSKKRKYTDTEEEIANVEINDQYDDKLLSILEEIKSLPNFLDVIFGFLYRRTDYYQIATEPNLGIGLPKGVAQKLLWQAFKKYETTKHEHKEKIISISNDTQVLNEEAMKPISEVEKDTPNKSDFDVRLIDTYNGAVFENYAWSQSVTDLDIQIKIPDKITCKQLQVDIASSKMLIKLKNTDTVYLKGDLCKKCKVNETVWSLGGHLLQIHLEKESESWWDCLLKAEPKLDFNKMDRLRSEEVRAKIKEIAKSQIQIS